MIVGIAGAAGSGKNTVGDIFRGYGYVDRSFAEPIKEMLCTLLGVPMTKWDDRKWRERVVPGMGGTVTPRILAQTLGTEWGRDVIYSNIWVNIALNRIPINTDVIFTDVRFINEAEAITARGGVMLKVVRHIDSPIPEHSSEHGLDGWNGAYIIENFGSLEELKDQVTRAYDYVSNYRVELECQSSR